MHEIRCFGCGKINRVPRYTIYRIPRCAACHLKLPEPQSVITLRRVYKQRGRWLLTLGVVAGVVLAFVPDYFRPTQTLKHVASAVRPDNFVKIEPPLVDSKPIPLMCVSQPGNGGLLYPDTFDYGPHPLEIDNGTDGVAIIKVRDAGTGHVVVSFLVHPNSTTTYRMPDGVYRIQYAIGDYLAEDCRSLAKVDSSDEYPDINEMMVQPLIGGGISYKTSRYTLNPVPGGTVIPRHISMDEFNAP